MMPTDETPTNEEIAQATAEEIMESLPETEYAGQCERMEIAFPELKDEIAAAILRLAVEPAERQIRKRMQEMFCLRHDLAEEFADCSCSEPVKEAERRGAERMREAAAEYVDRRHYLGRQAGPAIRALPTEPASEEKSK